MDFGVWIMNEEMTAKKFMAALYLATRGKKRKWPMRVSINGRRKKISIVAAEPEEEIITIWAEGEEK